MGIGGGAYGLSLTWLCMLALERFHWFRDPNQAATGCHELGKCPFPWWEWIFFLVYLFGPAIIYATINVYAWKKWSIKYWACCTASTTLIIGTLYLADSLIK